MGPNPHERPLVEYLHFLRPAGAPAAKLRLKIGTPIMLQRNMNPDEGLGNGTRMVVTKLGRYSLEAKILSGCLSGQNHIIPRIKLIQDDDEQPFPWSRRQIPIAICFAMTINKAQG